MSNIPKSERKPTKKDFFDKAIDVRKKVVDYIVFDFSDEDYVKQKIRNPIRNRRNPREREVPRFMYQGK